jgi:XTP/dITP diphosphohydrolase
MRLVFATTNQGKLRELEALVRGLPIAVVAADRFSALEVVEDGLTLEENALKKARAWAEHSCLPALADDTGLCVDALGGAPGVRSARFSGIETGDAQARYRANNRKLLEMLAGVPTEKRSARFECALCLFVPGRPPLSVKGECAGRILQEERGTRGFGYDPLFEVVELGRSFAELTEEEKNRISHRARAFQALRKQLERLASGAKI